MLTNISYHITTYTSYVYTGNSTGTPSEQGLILDAYTAYQWLHNNNTIDNKKLFIFGRSLGGAVNVALAYKILNEYIQNNGLTNNNNDNDHNIDYIDLHNKTGICGIMIENTFISIEQMAQQLFIFLKLMPLRKLLLTLKWPTIDKIKYLLQPILFLSSTNDEIVPPIHMKTLYNNAIKSIHKQIHYIVDGKHNDAFQVGGQEYIDAMNQFIDHCLQLYNLSVPGEFNDTTISQQDNIVTQNAVNEWLDITDEIVK